MLSRTDYRNALLYGVLMALPRGNSVSRTVQLDIVLKEPIPSNTKLLQRKLHRLPLERGNGMGKRRKGGKKEKGKEGKGFFYCVLVLPVVLRMIHYCA